MTAVRYLTAREKFSILQPSAPVGTGLDTVYEVLQEKHPLPWLLKAGDFPNFPDFTNSPPPFSTLDITDELISNTARKMSGAGGLSGTDSYTLKSWLLYHRDASASLQQAFARFTVWQANNNIPWAAI